MIRERVGTLCVMCAMTAMATGCATILSGTKQSVTVGSNPAGAFVKVGNQTGTTPTTFTVPKGKTCAVEISHAPGKRVVELKRQFDPVTLLNLIPPFWPGFIVDACTGAMMKYQQQVVSVDFRTSPQGPNAQLTGSRP